MSLQDMVARTTQSSDAEVIRSRKNHVRAGEGPRQEAGGDQALCTTTSMTLTSSQYVPLSSIYDSLWSAFPSCDGHIAFTECRLTPPLARYWLSIRVSWRWNPHNRFRQHGAERPNIGGARHFERCAQGEFSRIRIRCGVPASFEKLRRFIVIMCNILERLEDKRSRDA